MPKYQYQNDRFTEVSDEDISDTYEDEEEEEETTSRRRSRQGFASMSPDRRRRIAAKGGRHSHGNYGKSHFLEVANPAKMMTKRKKTTLTMRKKKRKCTEDGTKQFCISLNYSPRTRHEEEEQSDDEEYASDENEDETLRKRKDHRQKHARKGRQGFASMSPERRREIARMGGLASKLFWHRFLISKGHKNTSSKKRSSSGRSRQGFASMSPERRREIARMGGLASTDFYS